MISPLIPAGGGVKGWRFGAIAAVSGAGPYQAGRCGPRLRGRAASKRDDDEQHPADH